MNEKKIMDLAQLAIGQQIRFLKTITQGPTEDAPAFIFAKKGELGVVTGHGCKEGHWVRWDGWQTAAFGAELGVDFEAIRTLGVFTELADTCCHRSESGHLGMKFYGCRLHDSGNRPYCCPDICPLFESADPEGDFLNCRELHEVEGRFIPLPMIGPIYHEPQKD